MGFFSSGKMSTVTRRGPNSPIGYLGARKARNQQKRFGIRKFYPKPRTTEQWHEVYLKHKVEVPNVQQITLKWSSKGAGQTGIRHFSVGRSLFFSTTRGISPQQGR